ncbi:universal stress protein [Spirillospora sp. NPDC000708]|uniref:universal stress protein n=1 Tax=Actinomadura nitritigenes TaxID=134602 RepID=UPI00335C0320
MGVPIVIGTDGSDEAARALDWAAAEAVLRERPLHIVHAIESRPNTAPLIARSGTAEPTTCVGRRVLAAAGERVRERWPDLETTTVLVTGETWQALGAESENAFELVLGSRGLGDFAALRLGSTSLRMAERSTVPVVIVRGDAAEGGEVLVGIDPVREAGAILDYAFDAAALHGARLRVVHAWQSLATFLDAGYADVEQIEADLRRAVIAACRPLRGGYPAVDVVDEIVLEHPVTALSRASREARLLVVGARDWHWTSPRLGSVSHGVSHHAQCPVAVVPSR